MNLTFLVFVVGLIYGILNPGKENKLNLLRKAIIIGVGITLLTTLLIFVFITPAWIFLPFISVFGGIVGIFAGVFIGLYFGMVFVIGAFVGDLIESAIRR